MKPKQGLSIHQQIKYIQDTLYVMGGKWRLPIMLAMFEGSTRFRDIQRSVPPITTRVLSKELKLLEDNKLVIRTVYDTSPVSIEYTLAPYCKSLRPLVKEMIRWGKNHRMKVIGKLK